MKIKRLNNDNDNNKNKEIALRYYKRLTKDIRKRKDLAFDNFVGWDKLNRQKRLLFWSFA